MEDSYARSSIKSIGNLEDGTSEEQIGGLEIVDRTIHMQQQRQQQQLQQEQQQQLQDDPEYFDDASGQDIELDTVSVPAPPIAEGNQKNQDEAGSLTTRETWNLILSLLAWACTICNVTLVVGTSSVVVMSIGGDTSISSVPLGVFFFGASLISLTVTPWLFDALGRKGGFIVGSLIGLVGSGLGAISVWKEIPSVLIVASGFFGASTGIGFFLRFAALEVVPVVWSSRALALVVSGGCLAAFIGPESAEATRTMFGDDLEHLGVYFMTALFCILNTAFIGAVRFPDDFNHDGTTVGPLNGKIEELEDTSIYDEILPVLRTNITFAELCPLLSSRHFLVPMLLSSCSWAVMAVPMSMVRIAMTQVGYSSRQTLTVIELHFLSMYVHGFFTGNLIRRYDSQSVAWMGAGLFAVGAVIMILARSDEESGGRDVCWAFGMIFGGLGWGLSFTAATSWLTAIYTAAPKAKSAIQSANDFLFFLLSGAWIFSASYIYNAGGAGIEGWRTLVGVVVGLLSFMVFVLVVDQYLEEAEQKVNGERRGSDVLPITDHRSMEDHRDRTML